MISIRSRTILGYRSSTHSFPFPFQGRPPGQNFGAFNCLEVTVICSRYHCSVNRMTDQLVYVIVPLPTPNSMSWQGVHETYSLTHSLSGSSLNIAFREPTQESRTAKSSAPRSRIMLLLTPIMAVARSHLVFCSSRTFSSTVSRVISR
jgi:hypothetical protein